MDEFDVFLSYGSSDQAVAEVLARRLLDAGLRPFFDRWHLIPGKPVQEALEQALTRSRGCLVCRGPGPIGPWQNEEMRAALAERLENPDYPVIPVLLPGATDPEDPALPAFLRRLSWVDLREGLDDDENFRRLLAGIRGVMPGPPIMNGTAPGGAKNALSPHDVAGRDDRLEDYLKRMGNFEPDP